MSALNQLAQSASQPELRRGPPTSNWPGVTSSRGTPTAYSRSGEDWIGSSALDYRFRPSFGPTHPDWKTPTAIAFGSPRLTPTPLGWSQPSTRREPTAFHPNFHLLDQQLASHGSCGPPSESTYVLHPSDPFLRPPTAFCSDVPLQTIFRGSLTFGSHLPVTPPSPVASVNASNDGDDSPSCPPAEMGLYGDPWTFQQPPVQSFAYPSSSLRRGVTAIEGPDGTVGSFGDDEAEINSYLSATRSPPRLLMSSLVSRAPSPSPTSSLPSLTYSTSDRSAELEISASGRSATPSPSSTLQAVDLFLADSTPSPTASRPASDKGSCRRTRAGVALSLASNSASCSAFFTTAKRLRSDEASLASAPATASKRPKITVRPVPTSTSSLAPLPKSGKRKGKAPSSCAECRRRVAPSSPLSLGL